MTIRRRVATFPDDGSWDLEIPEAEPERTGGEVHMPSLGKDDRVTIVTVAKELGRDVSAVRRAAKKLGVLLEKRWVRDASDKRQPMTTTDAAGVEALRRWYER